MSNRSMIAARRNKNDEFYTLISDIEKELNHYKNQFENKIVYCNCDDPNFSNFWNYFHNNFQKLKLKKLVATYYNPDNPVYKFEYNGTDVIKTELKSNGDFRNDESIQILKESDVVCTNPPFSLYREYIAQLITYQKDFLIIGNFNSVTYKEIFPLIKNNKMWTGYTSPKTFIQPNGTEKRFGNISWFTNLDIKKRHKKLMLKESYDPNKYPKYDNYNAIEVSRVKNIPKDYNGIMGVPITFLNKHNPNQFEILGSQRWSKSEELLKVYTGSVYPPENDKKTLINGKETYDRIFIKNKHIKEEG